MMQPPHIDGYQIQRLLGRGGMASVYAAVETALGREVAIKIVRLQPHEDMENLSRLEQEARSLARLRHPHIVDLYRFGRIDAQTLYYVMPLLSGGDLSARGKPLPELHLRSVMVDLLAALAHAHHTGIVHRDIKPENILFDGAGRPLLADFGAARSLHASRLTQAGFAIGSVGYMSPEQARGADVGARSDLYSLATVAYEYLLGSLPFTGPDALAVALAQMEKPVPSLPDALAHWQEFFQIALHSDPWQRYPDAQAMQDALPSAGTRTVLSPVVTTASVSAPTRIGPITNANAVLPPTRWRTPLARLALGVAATLVGVIATYAWLSSLTGEQTDTGPGRPDTPTQKTTSPAALAERDVAALARAFSAASLDQIEQADGPLATLERQWQNLPTGPRERLAQSWLAAKANALVVKIEREKIQQLSEQLAPQLHATAARAASFDLLGSADWQKIQSAVETRADTALRCASSRYDPAAIASALPFARSVSSAVLAPKISAALAVPGKGGIYLHNSGLRLVLLQAPTRTARGLSIMQSPIEDAWYQNYLKANKRSDKACGSTGVRGCLSLNDAQSMAAWLNRSLRTGEQFALPTRAQWAAAASLAPRAPGFWAWTGDCQMISTSIRPNLAARTWGGIKKAFGGKGAEPKVSSYCEGNYLLSLDGQARTKTDAAPASGNTAVLMLSMPSLPARDGC
jgi:serine/threonine-protein kinase PpkA